jgi:hypothetical protein
MKRKNKKTPNKKPIDYGKRLRELLDFLTVNSELNNKVAKPDIANLMTFKGCKL